MVTHVGGKSLCTETSIRWKPISCLYIRSAWPM